MSAQTSRASDVYESNARDTILDVNAFAKVVVDVVIYAFLPLCGSAGRFGLSLTTQTARSSPGSRVVKAFDSFPHLSHESFLALPASLFL